MLYLKRKNIVIIFLIIIIILSIKVKTFINNTNLYSNVLNSNWSIDLPKEYEEVYSSGGKESFLGDGKRYHVFKYHTDDINSCIDWSVNKDLKLESHVNDILKTLNVPEENMVDFNNEYKYFYKMESDSSKLYIIFIPDSYNVYILEDIQ